MHLVNNQFWKILKQTHASILVLNPQCNSPIEAHQGFLPISSSEPQAPGGSGLEDTDRDDDIMLAECELVAVKFG